MKYEIELRNENDQEENTWFSTNHHQHGPEITLNMTRGMFLAIGSPPFLNVEITPKWESSE